MKESRSVMGMPVTVEITGAGSSPLLIEEVFSYFVSVDERFSTYKKESEIMRFNRGEIFFDDLSPDMRDVLALAEKTKQETGGYFDITRPDGSLDPSGIVKGWAILRAANLVERSGARNFYIDAGGDIQSQGLNAAGEPWTVGIRNPFDREEVVKILRPNGRGVATSGTYIRGAHIYNPHAPEEELTNMVSMTVIGPNVCEADRFATACFAMGARGMRFIESLPGFEGYAINKNGVAEMTSGFEQFSV